MRAVMPLTNVLDRVYAPSSDVHAWLANVHRAAHDAFEGHIGVAAYLLRVDAGGMALDGFATESEERKAQLLAAHGASSNDLGYLYGTAPLLRSSRILPAEHQLTAALGPWNIPDMLTAVGSVERSSYACILWVLPSARVRVRREVMTAAARLGAHFAAGYRLHGKLPHQISEIDAAEAVIGSGGAVLHASGAAKEKRARQRLRDAALAIARARREGARDPAEGLALWRAMVDGQWTLVERFDSDGKRFLLARRNAPHIAEHHKLTERERSVIERAALGASSRHVAYELGLSESTVSAALARGMSRLGIKTRAELVELRARLT